MVPLFMLIFGLHSLAFREFNIAECHVMIEVNPPKIDQNTTDWNLQINCSVQTNALLKHIYIMQLSRQRQEVDTMLHPIVEFDISRKKEPTFVSRAPLDIMQRSRVKGLADPRNMANTKLMLEMNVTEVLASDAGTYECKLVYQVQSNDVLTETKQAYLYVNIPNQYRSHGMTQHRDGARRAVVHMCAFLVVTHLLYI